LTIVTLLTDFGLSDHYVAAMKGVILSLCPALHLVDISHEVQPYSILEGAYTLAQAWLYFPPGTIHVVVVDPGVGSARRPILAEAGGSFFVCPDNGVLTMALKTWPRRTVRHITSERFFRHPVSATFHGRDVFGPVAAHLARGVAPEEFGPQIDDFIQLAAALPHPIDRQLWSGVVLKVDRFGNIITNFDWETFQFVARGPFELETGAGRTSRFCNHYNSEKPGEPFVVRGSSGFLEVSLNQANAAEWFGVTAGAPALLRTL
jgi:S-adenosylmethionine hydrolase